MQFIYEQMKQIDAWATSVMSQANTPPSISQSGNSDVGAEFVTARSVRAISRIKLSRYVLVVPIVSALSRMEPNGECDQCSY
jgi:hypothetical protein